MKSQLNEIKQSSTQFNNGYRNDSNSSTSRASLNSNSYEQHSNNIDHQEIYNTDKR